MQFNGAAIKSLKADLDKKDITISITVPFEQLDDALELANFMGRDRQDMTVTVTPRQLPMFEKAKDKHG